MTETGLTRPIGVLICDDSALVRLFLKSIVEEDTDMQVIALARNGQEAIEMARKFRPDVVTMDVAMPGLDGLSALRTLVDEKIAPVIMISSLTAEGADKTLEALEIGAFDFLPKPQGKAYYGLADQIVGKLKMAARWHPTAPRVDTQTQVAGIGPKTVPADSHREIPSYFGVALGASTGGPKALIELVAKLRADANGAFFLVQHMPRAFIAPFTRRLASRSSLECHVAANGERVETGVIYVADGNRHMTLSRQKNGDLIIRHVMEPKTLFIPSVNVTMQSVAEHFGRKGIGVLLTGMGNDGAQGILSIRQHGGHTIAESPKTAVVYGMPQEAVRTGGVIDSLPLPEIPVMINRLLNEQTVAVRTT